MNFFKQTENTVGILIILSLAAWYVCYSLGLVMVYNDAMSHMNIARLVIDSQQTGLAQIGSVWLPLGHVLKLPFIWIDPLWRNGFAGSIVSMISYVITIICLFSITKELTRKPWAAIAAAATGALNINLLYLQSTPLTEPLFLALFTASVLFMIKYLKTLDNKYLLVLALLVALQILTRYDGWFVAGVYAVTVLMNELQVRKLSFKHALGHTFLFATPVGFAVLLWLGWNAMTFGHPLFFATGPYSAQAQQNTIDEAGGLATKGDVLISSQTYGYGAIEDIGLIMVGAALIGWLLLILFPGIIAEKRLRLGAFAALSSVMVFNILALYLGFSTMNVPQINLGQETLFNVRYGVLALPLAAVGIGLLVAKWRLFAPVLIGLVLIQSALIVQEGPITLRDGQIGASAFKEHDIAWQLNQKVTPNDDVLISMSYFNQVAFASDLDLDQFVHEGVSKTWGATLHEPAEAVEWVVMSDDDSRDPVYSALVEKEESDFLEDYTLVYKDQNAQLYQRKTNNSSSVIN